jgi:hypothetical protein
MKAIIIAIAVLSATFAVANAAFGSATKTVNQGIERLKVIDDASMQ